MSFDRLDNRVARSHFVMARLQGGVDIEALDVLGGRLREDYPETNQGISFIVLPESEGRLHPISYGGSATAFG